MSDNDNNDYSLYLIDFTTTAYNNKFHYYRFIEFNPDNITIYRHYSGLKESIPTQDSDENVKFSMNKSVIKTGKEVIKNVGEGANALGNGAMVDYFKNVFSDGIRDAYNHGARAYNTHNELWYGNKKGGKKIIKGGFGDWTLDSFPLDVEKTVFKDEDLTSFVNRFYSDTQVTKQSTVYPNNLITIQSIFSKLFKEDQKIYRNTFTLIADLLNERFAKISSFKLYLLELNMKDDISTKLVEHGIGPTSENWKEQYKKITLLNIKIRTIIKWFVKETSSMHKFLVDISEENLGDNATDAETPPDSAAIALNNATNDDEPIITKIMYSEELNCAFIHINDGNDSFCIRAKPVKTDAGISFEYYYKDKGQRTNGPFQLPINDSNGWKSKQLEFQTYKINDNTHVKTVMNCVDDIYAFVLIQKDNRIIRINAIKNENTDNYYQYLYNNENHGYVIKDITPTTTKVNFYEFLGESSSSLTGGRKRRTKKINNKRKNCRRTKRCPSRLYSQRRVKKSNK